MKRPLLLLLLILTLNALHAQGVRIDYDKLSGTVKYNRCAEKNGSKVCKQIDKPKLKNGDVVELKLTNINEFVYKAKTVTHVDEDTTETTFGSGFGGFLGSAQSLFGNLNFGAFDISQMQQTMGGMFNMGGSEALIPDEVQRELIPIQARQKDVEQGLDRIIREVRAVDATLQTVNELKMSRTMTLAQIRARRDSVIGDLTAMIPGVMEEGYALRTGRDLSDHLAAANRMVDSEQNLMASLNNELLLTAPRRKKEDLAAVEKNFDAATLDAHINEISAINSDLDKATFEYTETVTLDNEDATGMLMNVEIYDQTQIVEQSVSQNLQPGKVVRYFGDRWITPWGQLTDTLCEGCLPLRSAEGFYFGSPMDPAMGTVNNDIYGRSGAYGQWKRYDRNGKLVEEFFIDRPDLAGLVNVNPSSGPSHVLAEKKVLRLPVDRGLILSTSFGVAMTTLVEAPKQYRTQPDSTFGYSILLETSRSNIVPVISSYFNFHWDSQKSVHFGGNMGIGMALSQPTSLNVMGGPSFIFGKKQTLILNMGVSGSQVDRKLDYLPVNEPFESSLAANGITEKQWALGVFVGISFGVGITGK